MKNFKVFSQNLAKFLAFCAVAFGISACDSGPDLEVTLHQGITTLNSDMQTSFGGTINWGQLGDVPYAKQHLRVVSLEDEPINIYKVEINRGNCQGWDSYALDAKLAEQEAEKFNKTLPKIGDIFFALDENYYRQNGEILLKSFAESAILEYVDSFYEKLTWGMERSTFVHLNREQIEEWSRKIDLYYIPDVYRHRNDIGYLISI